jgi:DNA-binding MarR family transcriptional regulator
LENHSLRRQSLPGSGIEERVEFEEKIIAAIRRIVRAIDIQSRQLSSKCGLTGPQLATLKALAKLGRPSLGDLAREVAISKATLTGIVDRLERQMLMVRSRDGVDRRKITVALTPKGIEILTSAPPLLQDTFRTELRKLHDWERASMLSTLQHVAALMDAERIVAAAPFLTAGGLAERIAEASSCDARSEPAPGNGAAAGGDDDLAGPKRGDPWKEGEK